MDREYSFLADALSKFQTAPIIIQALCVLAAAAVPLGIVWCLTAPFRLWLKLRSERSTPQGQLRYGVIQIPDGRWLVYIDGAVNELDAATVEQIEAGRMEGLSLQAALRKVASDRNKSATTEEGAEH